MSEVETVRGLYAAFAIGDVPAVLAALDANIDWREAEGFPYADRNPYIGPEAVLHGVFARLGGEWDGWNLKVDQVLAVEGGRVLATGRYRATCKATGTAIDAQFAHLWRIANGRAVTFQQYADTRQVTAAMALA